jgi:hypothetical protein
MGRSNISQIDANISQRKKEQAMQCLWGIFNVSRLQPATLVEYSPNNHHQAIASSSQRFPLFHIRK